MMKAVLLVFTILIGISLLVEGDKCQINGQAKMKAYGTSNYNMNLKLPCKFDATNQYCDGYRVHVAPGLAYDTLKKKKPRYFIDAVIIGIFKHKTDFYWRGRTTSDLVYKYFAEKVDNPFQTREEDRNFDLGVTGNNKTKTVTLQVGKVKIVYTAYDSADNTQRRINGLEVTCDGDAEYKEGKGFYPVAICGNKSDVMTARRKELGFGSRKHTVMYDLLNNGPDVYQSNTKCDTANAVFSACSSEDRVEAIKECFNIMGRSAVLKCQLANGYDPMDTFIYCLKFKCKKNDFDSCGYLKDREKVCSKIAVLQGASCPKEGPGNDNH